jgi:two-component system chemotaxis sensor kinase CheA
METVLQMLRSGEAKPNSKLVDALLAGVDALNGMLADIEASEKVEIQKILDKLGSLLAKQVSPKARKELQRAVKIVDADGRPAGFEVSEFVLKNRPKEHEFLYIFKYDLQELQSKGGVSPLALVKELLSMGEILSASLNTSAKSLSEDLSKHSLRYEVLYSTVLEPELAVKASKLPEDRVLRVFGEDDAPAKKGDVEAEAPEAGASVDQEAADRAEEREERKEDSGSAKKSSAERSDTIRMNLSILDKL